MFKFDKKKSILYIAGIIFFTALIVLLSTINTDSDNSNVTITTTNLISKSPKPSITKNTIEPTETENTSPSDETTYPSPDKSQRDNTWKTSQESYFAVVKNFRNVYICAVNTKQNDLSLIIDENSNLYKDLTKRINTFKKEKIILELKDMKITDFKEKDNIITIKTNENIGQKKEDKENFSYTNYNVEYILKIENAGLLIENIKSSI